MPIFKAEYKGDTTQDQQHCIPEGMSVLDCEGTCNMKFSTNIIKATRTYLETLEIFAEVVGPKVEGSFGASVDYKHVEVSTESSLNIFTQSETSCCVYSAFVKDFGHPQFDPAFVANLKALTDVFDPDLYIWG